MQTTYITADIAKSVRKEIEAISRVPLHAAEATTNTVARTSLACRAVLGLYRRGVHPLVPVRAALRNEAIAAQVELLHNHFANLSRYYDKDSSDPRFFSEQAERAYKALDRNFQF